MYAKFIEEPSARDRTLGERDGWPARPPCVNLGYAIDRNPAVAAEVHPLHAVLRFRHDFSDR